MKQKYRRICASFGRVKRVTCGVTEFQNCNPLGEKDEASKLAVGRGL